MLALFEDQCSDRRRSLLLDRNQLGSIHLTVNAQPETDAMLELQRGMPRFIGGDAHRPAGRGPADSGECKPFLRYFARPLNPCASIGILKMVMAVFRTLAGVVISLPSGPSAPLPTTYSVLLPGPEN